MEATHTPGPWDVDEGDLSIYALDERGGTIPLFQPHEDCDGEMMTFAEALDNARLAAAAPDLLEALKALQLQALQSPDLIRTEWGCEALDSARTAIAKAEAA